MDALLPDVKRQEEFVGMIFHELKTPLTILSALLQISNANFESLDETTLQKNLVKAEVQVLKIKKLVSGFLKSSFLESGTIDIQKKEFKLDYLIGEITEEARYIADHQYIILDAISPIIVNADRDKIACVLSNLLCNAVKYSEAGKCIYVKCFKSETHVIVRIKDEGIGIHKENLEKVFERYFRADREINRNIEGYGIGLHLCATIIKQHDGLIWAESEGGNGSTFYFSLPLS